MIQTIEGIFDGENMVSVKGRIHPIPPNYASKSKLLQGDHLKLNIMDDGSFVYKQIKRVEARRLRGVLIFNEEDKCYQVRVDDRYYNVLYASVTYFKASEGDNASIVVPMNGEATWAALENIIKEQRPDPTEEEL